jgi:hypothetical protein
MKSHLMIVAVIGVWSGAALAQTAPARTHSRPAEVAKAGISPVRFRPVVICDTFPAGYQAAVADMNGDGRPDIVALGENQGTVDWFQNPGNQTSPWQRHPISGSLTHRNIDLAINDIDGDGRPDVAVASDFDLAHSDRGGTVSWLHRKPGAEGGWIAVRIHAEPTAHRIRWADIDGDKRKELITVPIVGAGANLPSAPGAPVRLMCHWIPRDPAGDPWPAQVFDQSMTIVHGVFVIDWDADGRDELLTASAQGIHLFNAEGRAPEMNWTRRQLAAGHPGEPPNSGSSEVCVGRGRDGARLLAAIEPWHGNELAVYAPPPGGSGAGQLWRRKVIDDSLPTGHALCCADLDGDGCDEIVAGYRGEGTSLLGYRLRPGGSDRWDRFVIDAGGIAAQGCVAADMDGDGRIDLVATGGTTHNVKLYRNVGRPAD